MGGRGKNNESLRLYGDGDLGQKGDRKEQWGCGCGGVKKNMENINDIGGRLEKRERINA